MKTIKANQLRETLTSKGVDEGFIDRIFKRLEKSKSDAQLKAIDKEIEDKKLKLQQLKDNPEYKKMKKKYNLKDIPTRSGEEVDLDDFLKNTQKQIKNFRSSR